MTVAVAIGFLWRLVLAILMPTVSRDGVTFCWYARDLGERGLAYLTEPTTHQHPLFPTLILGAHTLLRTSGFTDGPLLWQISGQVITVLAGTAVIALVAALTFELARRLELPAQPLLVAAWAAWLAALLPLNTWLSADVMSDQVLLAFYLAALLCLLKFRSHAGLLVGGVCAGLAFLTRPEGIALLPVGVVTIALLAHFGPIRQRLAKVGLWIAGFLLLALPFWAVTGELSTKRNVEELLPNEPTQAALRFEAPSNQRTTVTPNVAASLPATAMLIAKLEREPLPLWLVPIDVFYKTLRAGRIVVVVLAALALGVFWRRLLAFPWLPLALAFILHAGLIVLHRWTADYLQPRHTLVLVALLMPAAALTLSGLPTWLRQQGLTWARWPLLVLVFAPLAIYSLRVPNGLDRYLHVAADEIRALPAHHPGQTLISGASQRRIAFYAELDWIPWYEDPEMPEVLLGTILNDRPDYFAIEVGAGFEEQGNALLRAMVIDDWQIAPHVRDVAEIDNAFGRTLYVYRFDWTRDPSADADKTAS